MFQVPDFCRVCLLADKGLKDISKVEGNVEPLVNKLKLCVSEVEWPSNIVVMLCEKCIDRLNVAFEFKKQCLESTQTLQTYLSQLAKSKIEPKVEDDKSKLTYIQIKPNSLLPVTGLPNLVLTAAPTTTPNIILNIIPATNPAPKEPEQQPIFLNINNALHKIVPVVTQTKDGLVTQNLLVKTEETVQNVPPVMADDKSEELSVEIDPNCFDCEEENNQDKDKAKDWEDMLPATRIESREKVNAENMETDYNLMNFINNDHFMAPFMENDDDSKSFMCEQCGQICDTYKDLKDHITQIHKGKFPYNCTECLAEFALCAQYEFHMEKHCGTIRDTITLEDLREQDYQMNSESEDEDADSKYKCNVCPRRFSRPEGLTKHKARKHKQKPRKKYFIKGMKNAKCDICNREFSTQSYLQLHIKLHYRKMDYRRKVFCKDSYQNKAIPPLSEVLDKKKRVTTIQTLKPLRYKTCKLDIEPDEDSKMQQDSKEGSDEEAQLQIDESNSNEKKMVNGAAEDCDESTDPKELLDEAKALEGCNIADLMGLQDSSTLQPQLLALKVELVEGKPKCIFCSQVFERKDALKVHLNSVHLKSIQYKCHLCSSHFYDASQLTKHVRQHGCFVRCVTCSKEFCSPRDIKEHIDSSDNCAGNMQCSGCGQEFEKMKRLKEHLNGNVKCIVLKCHLCGNTFGEQKALTNHLLEHNNMYSCNVCNATFSSEQEMKSHRKLHPASCMDGNKFVCPLCKNRYRKKQYLRAHINHTHPGVELDLETEYEIGAS